MKYLILAIGISLSASSTVFAGQTQRVLLLNSYHLQYRWTDELVRGVRDELSAVVAEENIHIEFMDGRRFVEDAVYHRILTDLLVHKYHAYRPDVIITSDDAAFYFMAEYADQLFPGVPVVFCGVNVFDPASIAGKPLFAGIQEGMEIEGNLDLILRLQPETRRIVMLGDTTGLGLRMVNRAKTIKSAWMEASPPHNVELEIWDSFSIQELLRAAATMDRQSVFLMLAIHKDSNGRYFSFATDLKELSRVSNVPIYGMWGALMIGNGAMGGMMNDPYEHGRAAAAMASRILAGEAVEQMGVLPKSRFVPQFDFNQLRRFGIELDRLPNNAQLYFKPETFYGQYKAMVNGTIALLVFLVAVISVLTVSVSRRKQAERQLTSLNLQLERKVQQRTEDLRARNAELERLSQQKARLANTDMLTELPNRREGSRRLKAILQRSRKNHAPFVVAMLDLDDFKAINDTCGHNVGDKALVVVAKCLQRHIRPADLVCRWGGEEFLLLLQNTTRAAAVAVCERLRTAIAMAGAEPAGPLSVSIGLAVMEHGDDENSLLKRADQALYLAKEQGKNKVVCMHAQDVQ